jgi:SAM-dependent methyltransferase
MSSPIPPVWRRHLNSDDPAFDPSYHDNPRTEVVDRLGIVPKCLLEIGCGSGATGRLVKERFPGCRVIGVESNARAAEVARQRIDQVHACTFEALDADAADFPKGQIDAVLLLDVLEHMYDPWRALLKLKPLLAPGARVVASIPNVRNLVLMDQLARGAWTYEATGLLDITHIRFFSLREMHKLFVETGYEVLNSYRLADNWSLQVPIPLEGQRVDLDIGSLVLKQVSRQDVLEMTATQFLLVVQPGAGR